VGKASSRRLGWMETRKVFLGRARKGLGVLEGTQSLGDLKRRELFVALLNFQQKCSTGLPTFLTNKASPEVQKLGYFFSLLPNAKLPKSPCMNLSRVAATLYLVIA
jgi:hypothetical protein